MMKSYTLTLNPEMVVTKVVYSLHSRSKILTRLYVIAKQVSQSAILFAFQKQNLDQALCCGAAGVPKCYTLCIPAAKS